MTEEEKDHDSGFDSPVIVPQPRPADAIISPTPQDRAQGLAGLLLGADYSSAQEEIFHADPELSKTIAIEGFGTTICLTLPSHLLVGQVSVLVRGTDWLDTEGVSARPIALFQVVEVQPPRLRKIYQEGPDKVLLVANEPLFALNQFGIAAAENASTAHTLKMFLDFVAATDIRRSHRSAIQLAGPSSAPIAGLKRGNGSDDEEAPPPTSYQKQKDRRSFNPFRALLMLDEDLFQFYVRDAPTVTDAGFLARMKSQVPEQFRARLLAGEARLLPLQ